MARAYYNEINKTAAQWLRNLIAAGAIADGDVDERSIEDVTPDDIRGYTQCHFFAGIGGWPYALRLAGWPDNRSVWTGSCPCQPFSQTGCKLGFADERHLWPSFYWLIKNCAPPVVFGEQVSGDGGREWFDDVFADFEKELYACAAIDLCAACVGAPHIRQRLYWMAYADSDVNSQAQRRGYSAPSAGKEKHWTERYFASQSRKSGRTSRTGAASSAGRASSAQEQLYRLAYQEREALHREKRHSSTYVTTSQTRGFWGAADWIFCNDRKWRAVEPGSLPVVDGLPGRLGRIRAYGNAIVPPLAAEFIKAYMEIGK